MAYTIVEPDAGFTAIAAVDSGISKPVSVSDGTTTTIPTPPNQLGAIVRAVDPTFGEGEFIFLAGVASTVVGSMVVWDGTTYATTLAAITANQGRPIAFAMSANVAATTFGWYQIGGTAVALKTTTNKFLAKVALGVTSVGKVGSVSSGKQILNARTANAATVASATTTVQVVINRPGLMGRVT